MNFLKNSFKDTRKIKGISILILSFVFFFVTIICVSAWTGPTSAPPNGNTEEPLNVSNETQVKYGSLYFPQWFDGDDAGYYLNPAGNSWLYRLYSYDIRSSIFYDLDNTNYYLNPSSSSNLNTIYASAYYYNSDEGLKKNIVNIDNSLDKILRLRGVSFNWKDKADGDIKSLGLVAQDVEKVFPELVSTNEVSGLKSVQYGNIVAPLIEAIKEQQKQIEELKIEIKNLKN